LKINLFLEKEKNTLAKWEKMVSENRNWDAKMTLAVNNCGFEKRRFCDKN